MSPRSPRSGFTRAGLGAVGKNYGVMLRIRYKQSSLRWITPMQALKWGASTRCQGHDTVLRLNTGGISGVLKRWINILKQFRFIWDGLRYNRTIVGYCVRSPVSHLYLHWAGKLRVPSFVND